MALLILYFGFAFPLSGGIPHATHCLFMRHLLSPSCFDASPRNAFCPIYAGRVAGGTCFVEMLWIFDYLNTRKPSHGFLSLSLELYSPYFLPHRDVQLHHMSTSRTMDVSAHKMLGHSSGQLQARDVWQPHLDAVQLAVVAPRAGRLAPLEDM